MSEKPGDFSANAQDQDDVFCVLRYCREHLQSRLVDIARESGITSPAVLEAITREIAETHDKLASSTERDGFQQTAGLTASRISLIGNDDLELDIRIGDVINHLKDNDQIDHWRVQLRYMTLLQRPRMNAENSPVGLELIRQFLWAICHENGGNLEQNLDQLDRLEAQLQQRLSGVYTELNGLLEHHHVEPAQVQIIRQKDGRPVLESHSANIPQAGNALASLQQALRVQRGGDAFPVTGGVIGGAPGDPIAMSANSAALGASAMVMLNHLMERLKVLEIQQLSDSASALTSSAFGQSPLRVLRSKDLDLPMGKPATIAIDTLSMIFEAIFAAPNLPDTVKATIGRLQIPLVKQAIIDDSFFANTQHPARQLVNRMARAAIGLPEDAGHDDPVCASLSELADQARSALDSDNTDLSPQIAALDAQIAERDQAIQNTAPPYIQLTLEHENRENAQAEAQNWLHRTTEKVPHPEIRKFLAECWLPAMQAAYMEGGTAGERWKNCDTVIAELLWSVHPKETAEERKQLLNLIPALLKRINRELDLAAIPTETRTPFLDVCFDLQTAALRNRQSQPPTSEAMPPDENLIPADKLGTEKTQNSRVAQILEREGKLVHYLGQPSSNQPSWRSGGGGFWKEGDWIRFQLPEGETLCGRICWQAPPAGTVLLLNPGWGYAVALAPTHLEQQLRDGQAQLVSKTDLFDSAAEQALAACQA